MHLNISSNLLKKNDLIYTFAFKARITNYIYIYRLKIDSSRLFRNSISILEIFQGIIQETDIKGSMGLFNFDLDLKIKSLKKNSK